MREKGHKRVQPEAWEQGGKLSPRRRGRLCLAPQVVPRWALWRAGPATTFTSITLETTEPGTTAWGRQDFLRLTASASLRPPDHMASSAWLTPS